MRYQPSWRVVVPTRDSAGWLLSFADAYRKLGLSPLYLFDTRSSDDTLALLRSIGADVVPVEPKLDRVEAMLAITRDVVDADWVVRFDDDEIPSKALIAWLNRSLGTIPEPSVGLSRRDAQLIDGRLYYARLEDFYFWPDDPTFLDPQLRAYRPREVSFDDTIHKPGFVIESFKGASQSAYFVHFNWLVRSFEQRRRKVIGYER